MKQFFGCCLILYIILSVACNRQSPPSGNESLIYNSRNHQMSMNMKLALNNNELSIEYQNTNLTEAFSQTYSLQSGQAQKIFDAMKAIDFHQLKMPSPEQLRDAGENTLTATYGGQTRSINLSVNQQIPENLLILRNQLFKLAKQYRPELASDMGL